MVIEYPAHCESERAEHDARPLLRYAAAREEAMADFKAWCDGLGSGNSRADNRAQIGMCTHGK